MKCMHVTMSISIILFDHNRMTFGSNTRFKLIQKMENKLITTNDQLKLKHTTNIFFKVIT